MSAKKVLALGFLAAMCGSLLYPQTLAEIAQKERERRAALKGKRAVVITNASLAKLKKKPALETPPLPPAPEAGEVNSPGGAPEPEPQEPPEAAFPSADNQVAPALKALQEKWEKAKEYVELLTLKMGALWQQYYNLEDMTAKEALQQSIAETFIKLQKAQEEETLARQELEKFLGQQKKESAASIWIR